LRVAFLADVVLAMFSRFPSTLTDREAAAYAEVR
jgi:hypothetical protein